MTREEFISLKKDSERRISRRVVPVGIIYSIRLVSPLAALILAALLWRFFSTEARTTILVELGVCVLLFVGSFPAEGDSRRQFSRLALKCPACQSCLVFVGAEKTVETGCCYECGQKVFDL